MPRLAALILILLSCVPALGSAQFIQFHVLLTGSQAIPQVQGTQEGLGSLGYTDIGLPRFHGIGYSFSLAGVDLDGRLTPTDASDDVIALSIHRANGVRSVLLYLESSGASATDSPTQTKRTTRTIANYLGVPCVDDGILKMGFHSRTFWTCCRPRLSLATKSPPICT